VEIGRNKTKFKFEDSTMYDVPGLDLIISKIAFTLNLSFIMNILLCISCSNIVENKPVISRKMHDLISSLRELLYPILLISSIYSNNLLIILSFMTNLYGFGFICIDDPLFYYHGFWTNDKLIRFCSIWFSVSLFIHHLGFFCLIMNLQGITYEATELRLYLVFLLEMIDKFVKQNNLIMKHFITLLRFSFIALLIYIGINEITNNISLSIASFMLAIGGFCCRIIKMITPLGKLIKYILIDEENPKFHKISGYTKDRYDISSLNLIKTQLIYETMIGQA
jgi:hypothetical protein